MTNLERQVDVLRKEVILRLSPKIGACKMADLRRNTDATTRPYLGFLLAALILFGCSQPIPLSSWCDCSSLHNQFCVCEV